MGCNCSSETEEDQEEIIRDEPETIHHSQSSYRQNRPTQNSRNNQNNHFYENERVPPTNSGSQQDSTAEITRTEIFQPLKDRYFGPVMHLPGQSVVTAELISELLFSGWKSQTVYKKPNIVNIAFKSAEGQAVINLFSQTSGSRIAITGISRIENVFLYAMYLLKKEEMQLRNGHVDELNLFHGTKKENVDSISNNNFDWRRCGDGVGTRFGKGVSFTPKASYALHYCDDGPVKVMFLAKVLVSKAVVGDENMSIPSYLVNGKLRFNDTSVKPNIDVVVKYGDNEFYPAYRITFQVK